MATIVVINVGGAKNERLTYRHNFGYNFRSAF